MNQPLVSMITYCYNGESFLDRYFNGILCQTYPNIELIFIDNGSEDGTDDLVRRFLPSLEANGIRTEYIHFDKNQSTCRMKMLGFEKMHGEYFFGCDSDDVLHPTYVEEMAGYLMAHPEKGLVFCQLDMIDEATGKRISMMKTKPAQTPKAAFVNILSAQNTIFTPISYMMSREHFLRINPKMEIYVSNYGENYQMLLPFLYRDLQGYIEKPLGDYYVREGSYSGRMSRDPVWQTNAYKAQEEAIRATLDQIGVEDRAQYDRIYLRRLRRERFYAAVASGDVKIRRECFAELRQAGGASVQEYLVNLLPGVYRAIKKR